MSGQLASKQIYLRLSIKESEPEPETQLQIENMYTHTNFPHRCILKYIFPHLSTGRGGEELTGILDGVGSCMICETVQLHCW